jgi:hypothetical protein
LSYQAEISRTSPTAILMVMDQSTSMNHRLNSGQSKAAFLADVLNKTLYTIITNCSKADGVRDYFHVGVVAYGGKDAGNGFQGALGDEPLHVISRIAEAPLRVETRTKKVAGLNGDVVEQQVRFPIWFEPRSQGKTLMCAGLRASVRISADGPARDRRPPVRRRSGAGRRSAQEPRDQRRWLSLVQPARRRGRGRAADFSE